MNDFLKELAELLKNYNAVIWASTTTQAWVRIGIECNDKSIEIDDNADEVEINYQRILDKIK